jgi:hypothetical protein
MRQHFGDLIARAPYREPPRTRVRENPGTTDKGRVAWALGCAAALALMVVLPSVADLNIGSRALGARMARTLESGVVQEFAARALDAAIKSRPFGHR